MCTSLCRLSATDSFIVAEQQRLVFLSLKESVFSPVEFNQLFFFFFGGGWEGAFPSRIFFLTYTLSSISWIHTVTTELFFYLNRHNTPVKNKHSFTCERDWREHLKGYHIYLTVFESAVGRVNLYSVKPHGRNSGARTALSAITCSHSHKQDLQPPIYTISLTGTFPNNNRWSLVGWKQNTTLHLRDHAHSLPFLLSSAIFFGLLTFLCCTHNYTYICLRISVLSVPSEHETVWERQRAESC